MTEAIEAALRPLPELPFAFFGHSLGAILAFELAHHLVDNQGLHAQALFVAAAPAPDEFGKGDPLSHLPNAQFQAQLQTRYGSWVNNQELWEMFLPALRSDLFAAENYRYHDRPPLKCGVAALVGEADAQATPAQANGWRQYASGPFGLQIFAGGHFFVQQYPAAIWRFVVRWLEGKGAGTGRPMGTGQPQSTGQRDARS